LNFLFASSLGKYLWCVKASSLGIHIYTLGTKNLSKIYGTFSSAKYHHHQSILCIIKCGMFRKVYGGLSIAYIHILHCAIPLLFVSQHVGWHFLIRIGLQISNPFKKQISAYVDYLEFVKVMILSSAGYENQNI